MWPLGNGTRSQFVPDCHARRHLFGHAAEPLARPGATASEKPGARRMQAGLDRDFGAVQLEQPMAGSWRQNFLCDEQKMQNTWGQPAWSGSEIDDCRVQTTTAQELRLMDPIKVSHTVVTPAGGLLTLADIQRELSKSLGSKKAETYNAQAAEVLEYSCRICLHEHVTHQI